MLAIRLPDPYHIFMTERVYGEASLRPSVRGRLLEGLAMFAVGLALGCEV